MNKIYCISGLGADHRIFAKLQIPGCQLVCLPWQPFSPNDNMRTYSDKMYALIPEENPIIIGVSFAGMLASEIIKAHPVRKVFLISSATSVLGLRLPAIFIGFFNCLLALIPSRLLHWPNLLLLYFFGNESAESRQLMINVVRESDAAFNRSALHTILSWHSTHKPSEIISIHGTADRLIPFDKQRITHPISDGGHMMIYDRAAEISTIISTYLV